MRVTAIRQEAEKLLREYGESAYDRAIDAVRAARRRRNIRLEKYLKQVVHEIERRSTTDKIVTRSEQPSNALLATEAAAGRHLRAHVKSVE